MLKEHSILEKDTHGDRAGQSCSPGPCGQSVGLLLPGSVMMSELPPVPGGLGTEDLVLPFGLCLMRASPLPVIAVPILRLLAPVSWAQESCPQDPQKAMGELATQEEASPTPHHPCLWKNWPFGMNEGQLAVTLTYGGCSGWRPRLANSATPQAHIQGFELAHPTICTPSVTCWST